MTAHSEHVGLIRGYSQTLGVSQGPLDAGMVRDSIVNNGRHLHDEFGQALFTLAKGSGAYWTQASPSASELQMLDAWPCPEAPLHKRADTGLSFQAVMFARVSISVAGTATFRIALHAGAIDARFPPLYSASDPASTPSVTEVTTTSTAGENVAVGALHLTAAQIAAARTGFPSEMGNGSLGTGRNFVGTVSVWAKASAGAPRLHSLCAREFIGT